MKDKERKKEEREVVVQMLDVAELMPYANNPRKNDKAVDAVAESIKAFGFNVPITVDANHVVVTGHTRLKAAMKLGMQKVPVIVLDELSPDETKAFRIADNKVGELAEWDLEALAIELKDIAIDMTVFSVDMPEAQSQLQEDGYKLKLPKNPKSKYGDVYSLGRHRLMCGDATKLDDVMKLTAGETADLVILDPPYNVNYKGRAGTIMNDNQNDSQFYDFLCKLFSNANSVLRLGGGYYIWHSENEGYNFRKACGSVGWIIRQCLIWNKNAFVVGRQDYQWKHEPCLYGWKSGAAHYFTKDRTYSTVYEEGFDPSKATLSEAREMLRKVFSEVAVTVIDENKPQRNEEHPTMKPVRLIGRLIANSSKAGDLVLDTVAGSGTVMVAAEELGRSAYMMELDPRYVDVIIDRYEKLTGNKAVKEQGK